MKESYNPQFDPLACRQELADLETLLSSQIHLSERADVLHFFQKRPHLSAFIGSYCFYINRFDRLAYEYDLFGDFACDLVIGDTASGWYCFVEFEDASPTILFVERKSRATRDWSPRFEHGYSQVIDWFWKLADMERSTEFASRFGLGYSGHEGILIAGRNQYLDLKERARLQWRRNSVVVHSKRVHCLTYDDLYQDLKAGLNRYLAVYKTEDEQT